MWKAAFLFLTACAYSQQTSTLDRAYEAFRAKAYEEAIELFRAAAAKEPARGLIHKELGYAYIRIGETTAARDAFAEAMRLDAGDVQAALEYAFLANDTKQRPQARRIFDRVRQMGNSVAERAFQNIDGPLAQAIERWRKALEQAPDNFSAHHELAQLAEQRDATALAAEHYEKAWLLKPALRELLVDLGRMRKLEGRADDAMAALLAASRGGAPAVAERARELLPARYPYVYEFVNALRLDPNNVPLRRELAYLHLAMNRNAEAEAEFAKVLEYDRGDSLALAQIAFLRSGGKPLQQRGDAEKSADARTLADRSLQAGYLRDALKYLRMAHEENPADYSVALKLGWAHNLLRDDKHAVHWFKLARQSRDAALSAEAARAYRNLRPGVAPVRTTAWMFPFYSSRWKDTFAYGQIKTEFKLGKLPVRPYLSARIIGDAKGLSGSAPFATQLSESSFILGAGLATGQWKGLTAWAEAGSAMRYVHRRDTARMVPDYRGGLSYFRSAGRNFGRESSGFFYELNADAVYISRFGDDTLGYVQNRAGFTLPSAGGLQAQFLWHFNATRDLKRQHWANFVEQGPGVRLRAHGLPNGLTFHASAVRGEYSIRSGNPFPPVFYDFRIGLWYAFTY